MYDNFFDEKLEMSVVKYIMNKNVIDRFFKEISSMEDVRNHRFFVPSAPSECKECAQAGRVCRAHNTFNFLRNAEKIFAVYDNATGIYITRFVSFVPNEPGISSLPPIQPLKKNKSIYSKVFDQPPIESNEKIQKIGEINSDEISDYYISNAFVTDNNRTFRVALVKMGGGFQPAFIPR